MTMIALPSPAAPHPAPTTDWNGVPHGRVTTQPRDGDARAVRHIRTGHKDKLGRVIGGCLAMGIETRTAVPDGEYCHYISDWVGSKYWVRPHATRDGKLYGASQGTRYFDTIEQVEAYMARYERDVHKRALAAAQKAKAAAK